MKTTFLKTAFVVFSTVLVLSACKKDKDEPNEEELITTAELTFTEVGGAGTVSKFTFKDLDGDGGNAPTVFENIVLAPSKTYNVSVKLLNESVTPVEDITDEIIAEAGDHQFYYAPTGVNVTVNNLNNDNAGLPLGNTSRWVTGAASNGAVVFTLKHKPGGIKAAGDPVTKGDTDIELNWVTRVQ
jgi:hypothetical protein